MRYIVILLLLGMSGIVNAQENIVGIWKTGEGNGHIEIYKNGTKYQGKIVWMLEPNDPKTGKPKTDTNHPDAKNHSRPILGLVNLWGFAAKDAKTFEGGRIYDPKNGKEYKCVMTLKDNNTLDVRGYVGITLIGRTDTWVRVR